MSNGKLKKIRFTQPLAKEPSEKTTSEPSINDIAKVYKDKNHRIKKALSFKSKKKNSKLA